MATQSISIRRIASKLLLVLLIFALVYLGLGLTFHVKWTGALDTCREARIARGESAESRVFSAPLALAFDVVYWPVYARANLYHAGTLFATPCTH
jgi:hypothetical protein